MSKSNTKEWWVNNVGQNLLKGVVDDVDNPILLDDVYILDFFTRIPASRISYERIYPFLLPAERERIQALYVRALAAEKNLDEKAFFDRVQHKWNTAGIFTSGPKGGTRRGGNN